MIGGGLVESAVVRFGREAVGVDGAPPYVVPFVVPADAIGRIEISVETFGDSQENYFATTFINVAQQNQLASLQVLPPLVQLTQLGRQLQLSVEAGSTSNTTVNVTGSAAGTTYTTSSGTDAVVSVSTEGVVEARGVGQDGIVVRNGTLLAAAFVSVSGSGFFADDPLIPRETTVQAVHFEEMRTRIDALRLARGFGAFNCASSLSTGMTVSADHLTDLRTALNDVYTADGLVLPTYTNAIAPGSTIRALDITQLRARIVARE